MTDITMPQLSDSMQEGTILTWLMQTGEMLVVGAELVEIETDKATMTYESPKAGVLTILAAEGTTLAVGTVIARADDASAIPPLPATNVPEVTANTALPPADAAVVTSATMLAAVAKTASSVPTSLPEAASVKAPRATPLARRIAQMHDIDLSQISGTGPNGRIIRTDVAALAAHDAGPLVASTSPAGQIPEKISPIDEKAVGGADKNSLRQLTRLQKIIAQRMVAAKAHVPEFQVQTEVAMDEAIALRVQLKALDGEIVISLNDLIVKAAALALREHPLVNASYQDDGYFKLHERVNVGIAVATEDALIVPTITDVDTRSLGSIAAEARRLAAGVRAGTITASELAGATFTVSNLGMYGMTAITPVINVPQAAILGVGAARPLLARADGAIIERQTMTLTLTCDHRILYGADAAKFLSSIRRYLERPLRLTA